jgi:flagella basal body P-ring formation protein FlgA
MTRIAKNLRVLLPVLLLAGLWAAAGRAEDLQEIVVRVLPQPEVGGETYTLGEVAEFDGFDVSAQAELARLPLGRSPQPGRSAPLSEGYLHSKLAAAGWGERARILMPRNAQVTRAGQTIAAAEIEERVKAQASKDAGVTAGDDNLKQEFLTAPQDVQLPKGALEWEVAAVGKYLAPGGDRTYQVTVRVEGREAWRSLVRIRQRVYQTVAVAARPIRRDQTITADDVAMVRKVLNASKETAYLTSPQQVIGMKAKRPIGQDELLHEGVVQAPNAIGEGARISVVFETDLLRMEVPGLAMVAGQLGQVIPVRNLQSGKVVYGTVQSDESVKVN